MWQAGVFRELAFGRDLNFDDLHLRSEVQLLETHLPVSHPTALAVAKIETTMHARLECIGTLRLQLKLARERWGKRYTRNRIHTSSAHTAYVGTLGYIATAPSIPRTGQRCDVQFCVVVVFKG